MVVCADAVLNVMPVMMIIAKADFDIRVPQILTWQSVIVICDSQNEWRLFAAIIEA